MVKNNNNAWIVYVIALIAILALVLAAVAIHKANMTGNGIFDFLKKQEAVNIQIAGPDSGLLGESFLINGGDIEKLKNYEVKYDQNGEMIYESKNDGIEFNLGQNYATKSDGATGFLIYNIGDGFVTDEKDCKCIWDPGMAGGSCTNNNCRYDNAGKGGCQGSCTGDCSCKVTKKRDIK